MDEAQLHQLMTADEDEGLEFKKAPLSRKEIAEYAVGIGNEGGGWLVMGITDRRPRRIVGIEEQSAADLQKLRDSVMDAAGIRIEPELVHTADGVALALKIPARPRGQIFFTRSGKYLMRTGEGLRAMTPVEIEKIRREEVGPQDFTGEIVHPDWREVLSAVEIERLRAILVENQRAELARLGDNQLLRSLELVHGEGKKVAVTRAAVLLLGQADAIRQFAATHEVKLQRFDRDELTPVFTEDSRAPILALSQRAAELIELINDVESFQVGMFRVDVQKYPRPAYREAVANALIHREYRETGNVAVRIYRNRIEVGSPGGWFGGVNERNILVTESRRRNELLASALQRIGLAERSSLGVKRMFRAMLEAGKQAPEYRSSSGSVTVVLRDGSFDRAFASLVRRCSEDGRALSVFDLLVLAHLRRHREITVKTGAALCQQTDTAARQILDDLRLNGLVDRQGEGRGRKYVLGPVAYEALHIEGERPRDLGMSVKTLEGLLLDELERRSTEGLTNREIREWSRYGRMQTTRLLQSLREKGKIVSSGKKGRGARYWLPQFAPKVQL
jgi:ATP-dependent DNA helicase RecG